MRLSAGSAAILAFGAASPGPQFSNMLTTFALSGLVGVQVTHTALVTLRKLSEFVCFMTLSFSSQHLMFSLGSIVLLHTYIRCSSSDRLAVYAAVAVLTQCQPAVALWCRL
jgi:hypothetical protein